MRCQAAGWIRRSMDPGEPCNCSVCYPPGTCTDCQENQASDHGEPCTECMDKYLCDWCGERQPSPKDLDAEKMCATCVKYYEENPI